MPAHTGEPPALLGSCTAVEAHTMKRSIPRPFELLAATCELFCERMSFDKGLGGQQRVDRNAACAEEREMKRCQVRTSMVARQRTSLACLGSMCRHATRSDA